MLKQIGTQAKDAAAEIAVLSTDKKNQILKRDYWDSIKSFVNAKKKKFKGRWSFSNLYST